MRPTRLGSGRRPGLAAADEIVFLLPPTFGPAENVRLLTNPAQTVAPSLGWPSTA